MLVHSIASHSPTIRKEHGIETPSNGKSLTKANLNIGDISSGSDWEMPTHKSPLHQQEQKSSSFMGAERAEHEMGTNDVLEPQSDEYRKIPDFDFITADDDDDDECDVPELIAEDSMEPTLRLGILQPEPTSTSVLISGSPLQGLFAAQPSPDTHLKTPTNSILKISITTTPLSSCLKKTNKTSPTKSSLKSTNFHSPTPRRVHGLWDDATTCNRDTIGTGTPMKKKNLNIFYQLRDETIVHCLSFLSGEPNDLLAVSQTGRRFRSLVTTSSSLWKSVDATNFVHNVYQQSESKQSKQSSATTTTKALAKLLLKYPPETLTIRDIGDKLQVDESFLPPAGRLKHLTLTHFQDLTDTHVHVMLLLLALPSKKQQQQPKKPSHVSSSQLQQLSLEHCPKLTNATVRSIASSPSCVELQSLSIRGDSGISDLLPLAKLLQLKPGTTLPTLRPKPTVTNPLASLFGGPPPAPKPKPSTPVGLHSLFGPPPSPPSVASQPQKQMTALLSPPSPPRNPTSALHSLFAPPGSSPQRIQTSTTTSRLTTKTTSSTGSLLPKPTAAISRQISNSKSHPTIPSLGRSISKSSTSALCTIDIRSTGIKPQAWLKCCQEATTSSSCRLALQSFSMDGDRWTTQLLNDWTDLISLRDLKSLNLATAAHGGNGGISNAKALEGATRLRSVNLSGHVCDDTNVQNNN